MKKTILVIALAIFGMASYSQTAQYRSDWAEVMDQSLNEYDISVVATGDLNLMLVFSGGALIYTSSAHEFIRSAGMTTWDSVFNDLGFQFTCFRDIDRCYTRSDILVIIYD